MTVPDERQVRSSLYDWIQSLLFALILCIFLFVFAFKIIDVNGSSMVPTLRNGDKLFVSNLFYTPVAGDVVVFKTDSYDPDKALVKRVIATEGQEVSIDFDNGIIYIDGIPIEEYYINETTTTKLDFIGPKTVPEGCLFVLGDNRNASTDSRKRRSAWWIKECFWAKLITFCFLCLISGRSGRSVLCRYYGITI